MQWSCWAVWWEGSRKGRCCCNPSCAAKLSACIPRETSQEDQAKVISSPASWSESTIPCRFATENPFRKQSVEWRFSKCPCLAGCVRISFLLLSSRLHLHAWILPDFTQNQPAISQQLSASQMHLLALRNFSCQTRECTKTMPNVCNLFSCDRFTP